MGSLRIRNQGPGGAETLAKNTKYDIKKVDIHTLEIVHE